MSNKVRNLNLRLSSKPPQPKAVPEDKASANLNEHCRPNIEFLLSNMGKYMEQNAIKMAQMQYQELIDMEISLKQSNPKLFQTIAGVQFSSSPEKDLQWGPNIYDIVVKSKDTHLSKKFGESMQELDSLLRSAKAYAEMLESKPHRESSKSNLNNSVLAKRSQMIGNYSMYKGSPVKTVQRGHEEIKDLHRQRTPTRTPTRKSLVRNDSFTSSYRRPASSRPLRRSVSGSGSIFITREEYDRLQRAIKDKDMQIEELTTRLSKFASKQLLDGNPNMADLSDKNRPTKIGEKFGSLYDEEWSDAFDAFREQLKYSEEHCIYILLRILRYAFEHCKQTAEMQLANLTSTAEHYILHPTSSYGTSTALFSPGRSLSMRLRSANKDRGKQIKGACIKHSKDFRKMLSIASIPEVQEMFREQILRHKLQMNPENLPKSAVTYADVCVELTWLMCIQDPPMVITWAKEGDTINTNYYKHFKRKGHIVEMVVWPVLFLHAGGPLVSKGYVLPR